MPPTLQYVCQASRWQCREVLQNKIRNVLKLSFYLGDNCLKEKNEGSWVISLPIELHFLPLCREQYGTHLAAGSWEALAICLHCNYNFFINYYFFLYLPH